jgi:hypothetical protein
MIVQSDDVVAVEASDADLDVALDGVIKSSGFTLEELRRQADAADFATTEARTAWLAIRGLVTS